MMMKKLCLNPPVIENVSRRQWESLKNKPKRISTLLLFTIAIFICCVLTIRLNKYSKNDPLNVVSKPSRTLECMAWNHTQKCPTKNMNQRSWQAFSLESECPEYFRWIHEDLRHWKITGITEEMVAEAAPLADFRLTILDGKIYVEKFRDSFQSRALFTLWGIAQLATWYGGKLPDLELMFEVGDRPVVKAEQYEGRGVPPPLFKYCSRNRNFDIVFPDWTFWGWAELNIKPWNSILKEMKESNEKLKWEEREPFAYWKGNPNVSYSRERLFKCNLTRPNLSGVHLYSVDWKEESSREFKHSNLANQCTHRYKIYVEGWAWSVSEKYILACNSPTLVIQSHFHDFYTRGMIPLHHYWPIRKPQMCSSLKFAVDWGNNHISKAKAIGEAGSRYTHEGLKMDHVYSYMFHVLNEYAKLLTYKPKVPANGTELCSELLVCPEDGNWRKFMEESWEKSPSESPPCTLPPPYHPRELEDFVDAKMKAIKEVEAWEDEYWGRKDHKN